MRSIEIDPTRGGALARSRRPDRAARKTRLSRSIARWIAHDVALCHAL
jgi:hypothetical protein